MTIIVSAKTEKQYLIVFILNLFTCIFQKSNETEYYIVLYYGM
jgi:hypothetical protein